MSSYSYQFNTQSLSLVEVLVNSINPWSSFRDRWVKNVKKHLVISFKTSRLLQHFYTPHSRIQEFHTSLALSLLDSSDLKSALVVFRKEWRDDFTHMKHVLNCVQACICLEIGPDAKDWILDLKEKNRSIDDRLATNLDKSMVKDLMLRISTMMQIILES